MSVRLPIVARAWILENLVMGLGHAGVLDARAFEYW